MEPFPDPTETVGLVEEVSARQTDGGKWDRARTTDVAKLGETPEHVVSIRHDGVKQTARSAAHMDPGDLEDWASDPSGRTVGTGVTVRKQANRYGGVSVEREEVNTEEVWVPARMGSTIRPIANTDRNGISYEQFAFGVTPANLQAAISLFENFNPGSGTPGSVALKASHNLQISPDFSPFTGTFNLRMTASPPAARGGGSDEAYYEIEWTGREYIGSIEYHFTYGFKTAGAASTIRSFVHSQGYARMGRLHGGGFWGSYRTRGGPV